MNPRPENEQTEFERRYWDEVRTPWAILIKAAIGAGFELIIKTVIIIYTVKLLW